MSRMIGTALFALLCAASVEAQAPVKRPRVGYAGTAAPPPPPAVVVPPVYYVPSGYAISGVPYLVLTDGSVAVNFGTGYERVLRPCATPRPALVPNGRDALGRITAPPGIAALQAGARGTISGTVPPVSRVACYSVDAGRVSLR